MNVKLSKSHTPKVEHKDGDDSELELEPDGEGNLLLSVRHADDETWRAVTVDIGVLQEMYTFGMKHT